MDMAVIVLTHADISVKSPDKFKAITRTLRFFFHEQQWDFFLASKCSEIWALKKERKTKQTKTNKIHKMIKQREKKPSLRCGTMNDCFPRLRCVSF